MEIDNLTPAAIWAANRKECSDLLWLVNRKLKDSGQPEYRSTPRAYWATTAFDRETRTYTVAVVVCAPPDAMTTLHGRQVVVHPQPLAAYHAEAWELAWREPLGEVRTYETQTLPVLEGQWLDNR